VRPLVFGAVLGKTDLALAFRHLGPSEIANLLPALAG
jgi:hypothetical protein